MKTIDTLVPDIQGLFEKPDGHNCDGARVAEFGNKLAETVSRRLAEVRGDSYLRMSNLGRGDRQLWYELNTDEPKEVLNASAKIKFLFGDILELMLLFLAKEAGHDVQQEQTAVELDGVKGSIDAVIDGVLVDCKSASTFAMAKFKGGKIIEDDPFGYMEQLSGYAKALGGLDGAFLAIDKTLGHIVLDYHPKEQLDSYFIRERIEHVREVLSAEEMPDRCYDPVPDGKSGNEVLAVNCSYCAFKKPCWSDANGGIGLRTFLYSKGPTHFVTVAKEPNVMELTF